MRVLKCIGRLCMEVKVGVDVFCSFVSPFGWLFRGSGRITTKYSKVSGYFVSEAEKCEKSI